MPAPGLLLPPPPVLASLCTLRCPACKCQAKTQTGAWHEKCKHSPPTATHITKPPSLFLARREGCFLAHQMEATYVTSWTADKNENSNIQSLRILTESAYFTFLIAFLFIVVLHRHLELFTGHIIDSRCLFHVNFTSYQCQSIIYQRLGIVRPKLSNFDSCATCPPSSTPVHPSASRRPLSNHITHPFHPSSYNF